LHFRGEQVFSAAILLLVQAKVNNGCRDPREAREAPAWPSSGEFYSEKFYFLRAHI